MENLINQIWGTEGHQFTIALEVVDADQVHHLIGMFKRGTLVAGCKIVRVDAHDMNETSKSRAARLLRVSQELRTEVSSMIDEMIPPVLSLE